MDKAKGLHTYKPYYYNRELSWLKFNERVLDEAIDKEVPLCERLSFVSIFQSNLDEFFMVRVGTLTDQMIFSADARDNKTQMTAKEQLSEIFTSVGELLRKKDRAYLNLMSEIGEYGIELISFNDIEFADAVYLENYFKHSIMPLLSPQIVGKKQPFPFLRNKEIYAVALLKSKNNEKLGIVPCSSEVFKRLIPIPSDKNKYMLVEELILHFMPQIFSKYTIKSKSLIRIIRNADIDVDDAFYDEDLDYRDFMEGIIKKRKRLLPVRVEFSRELDGDIVDKICEYLDLDSKYVFRGSSPLDLSFVFQIQDSLRNHPELFYDKRVPQRSTQIDSKRSILEQIKEKDKLLSYPYESMRPFLDMLSEAANDDEVVSIKMTLYRVAKQSKVVEALIDAAENGKDVLVLVELKARFDEENNIEWSRRLEEAGCTVIYGLDGYKVHSKLCLITKKTNGKIEYYTQIGTGNYNEKTARLYTDLSLMTYDQEIGEEAAAIFQALFMGETVRVSKKLLVAPNCLQNRLLDMIEEEIRHAKRGEEAYIGVKMNSLTDKKLMDKLIEASQAGVEIELIVRGICCLIPGVEGYTENIRVISIVGRFLEHSRIYIFGKEERQKIYIASADWMTRNTVHRVEVATPVEDPDLKLRLNEMFITMLSDNVQARELNSNGKYKRLQPGEEAQLNSQEFFYESAYEALESQEKNKIILQ